MSFTIVLCVPGAQYVIEYFNVNPNHVYCVLLMLKSLNEEPLLFKDQQFN